ncbi:MAG: endonuclease domain-containing protein [Candidatus Marinimicrobia bacterium]|nr:endonuclease domain-containing protein [Candidatus Neomarinimicrobiota bacterium]
MNVKYKYYRVILTEAARINRNNPTPEEAKLWTEVLINRQMMGYKFLRQKPLENFIVDFYCSKLQFVIEIDGGSHRGKEDYDFNRTQILQQTGLKIIRYYNREITSEIERVCESIKFEIQIREKELGLSGESL